MADRNPQDIAFEIREISSVLLEFVKGKRLDDAKRKAQHLRTLLSEFESIK